MPGAKLIVLAAFDKDNNGNFIPAFEPRKMDTEAEAQREARTMAYVHAGVVVWSREVDPKLGAYGPHIISFQVGKIPALG
jgi:hypothetical protein